MSAELIAQVRKIASRGRMDDADVEIVFDIADALEAADTELAENDGVIQLLRRQRDAAEAKLAKIDALHEPVETHTGDITCQECDTLAVPCPTRRILHPDNEGDET